MSKEKPMSLAEICKRGLSPEPMTEEEKKKLCEEAKRHFPLPSMKDLVSIQPMTAPTKIKFEIVNVKDLPKEEQEEMEDQWENVERAFKAVEADRKKNGTRFDQSIDIECPNCGDVLTYSVSSYNGHRHLGCRGECKVAIME